MAAQNMEPRLFTLTREGASRMQMLGVRMEDGNVHCRAWRNSPDSEWIVMGSSWWRFDQQEGDTLEEEDGRELWGQVLEEEQAC